MCVLLLALAAVAAVLAATCGLPAARPAAPNRPDAAAEFHKTLPSQEVWAVRGMDIDLPCNVTPPEGDHVNAIFWYFGSSGVPIYSVDARAVELSRAEHLALAGAPGGLGDLGGRAFLRGAPPPSSASSPAASSALRLTNVSAADEGEFRCRVDFRDSPTANRRVQLRVVEPPDTPMILDASGVEISIGGPFCEGFEMELQCAVTGGRPAPEVEWWLNGELIDAMVDARNASMAVNVLLVATVTRELWGAGLECRARPSGLTPALARLMPAVTRRVAFELSLRPLGVRLRSPGGDLLSAGRTHRFLCDAWGAVPAARVFWFLDGEQLRGHDVSETQAANATSSTLTLRLRPQDDGRDLECRAGNPDFPAFEKQDRRRLKVAYPPEATVVLVEPAGAADAGAAGDAARPDAQQGPVLREGQSARLRCDVRAQPPPTHIAWFHKGAPLADEPSGGGGGGGAGGGGGVVQPALAAGGRDLVLGRVRAEHAGDYECFASNREGDARSAPLHLRVHYAPRCAKGTERRRVGVMGGRAAVARCEVDASPAGDDVRFSWTEARGVHAATPAAGGRATDLVDASRVTTHGAVSEVSIDAPAPGRSHFGPLEPVELRCYATNSVGQQLKPCVVEVVPASAPEPPGECSLRNGSRGHLEVVCQPGHDGDLPQYFELEAQAEAGTSATASAAAAGAAAGAPLHRFLGAEPHFELNLLQPGFTYQLAVFAINEKGRSEPPVLLSGVRAPNALPRRAPHAERGKAQAGAGAASGVPLQPTPIILAVVIAAAVLLLGGMVATAALLACRRRHPPPPPPLPPLPLMPLAPHLNLPAVDDVDAVDMDHPPKDMAPANLVVR